MSRDEEIKNSNKQGILDFTLPYHNYVIIPNVSNWTN